MDFLLQPEFYSEQLSVSGLELLQFSFDSKTRNLARNLVLSIIIGEKILMTFYRTIYFPSCPADDFCHLGYSYRDI